ncbi:MAG: DUF192 domain-containing protein, partial [Selenomonadaceae bacterium]|nr:DUF192 domain-containing protein [Selenomonadaceae bacterium]
MAARRSFWVDGRTELQVELADSFLSRFLGLMGRSALPAGQGLLLVPCSSVH